MKKIAKAADFSCISEKISAIFAP